MVPAFVDAALDGTMFVPAHPTVVAPVVALRVRMASAFFATARVVVVPPASSVALRLVTRTGACKTIHQGDQVSLDPSTIYYR